MPPRPLSFIPYPSSPHPSSLTHPPLGLIFCVPTAIFLAALKNGGPKGALRETTGGKEIGAMHLLFLFGLLAATFGTTITCLETFTDILG